jgi:hypothetical protein
VAVLSNADRAQLWADLMREASGERAPLPLLKAELRAVIDAADTWADTNSTAYNTFLPQPGRGALSAEFKARILVRVIALRWLRGA